MGFQSRLLEKIERELEKTTDRTFRAQLICRKSVHRARLGDLDVSRKIITDLRTVLKNEFNASEGTWILLSEGIAEFYSHNIDRALDRLTRASSIATAASLNREISTIGCWLGHVKFQNGMHRSAASLLTAIYPSIDPTDHFAAGRAALSLTDMFGFAGDVVFAKGWGKIARLHATAEGDESALAAALFNAPEHAINLAMISDSVDQSLSPELAMTLREIESSMAFDSAFDGVGLSELSDGTKGHALVVMGKHEEALRWLQKGLVDDMYPWDRATIVADLAYAHQMAGNPATAAQFAEEATSIVSEVRDIDTRVFLNGRLSRYHSIRGDSDECLNYRLAAIAANDEFRILQNELREILSSLPHPEVEMARLSPGHS